jgi:hypothetical protein
LGVLGGGLGGAAMAVLAALSPLNPFGGVALSAIGIPGEFFDEVFAHSDKDTVVKFAGCWVLYAVLVFLPFRFERVMLPSASPRRDLRILRTSIPMLALASGRYYRCRFGEKPGGLLGGLGEMMEAEWLGPIIAIGLLVALAALAHLLWRRIRRGNPLSSG